ncbi:hypothetical protein MKZ38_003926 [Zalerion maritima]|uniref:Uncharacterized protein n=1 Tax=Zalerion maritima TaxID=339359 RepID=A0AAD5RNH5_9PEZI|nr:hypothetical protein MKZ38_003926 [Zalerion maritima]
MSYRTGAASNVGRIIPTYREGLLWRRAAQWERERGDKEEEREEEKGDEKGAGAGPGPEGTKRITQSPTSAREVRQPGDRCRPADKQPGREKRVTIHFSMDLPNNIVVTREIGTLARKYMRHIKPAAA